MKKIVFFLLIVSICSSCKMTDEKEEVSCTDDFRSFGIKVQYPDGSPVVLDSFKVVWGDRELTDLLDWELAQIAGYYPLVDDGLQGELKGLSVSVTAYGYLDGKEVFREDYLVGADECHVAYYDEKPFIVTIENGE
jgi:hypothetical protein